MEYPDGHWEYCSCGASYFLYDDGVGNCSACAKKRRAARDKKDRKIESLKRQNRRLKAKIAKPEK